MKPRYLFTTAALVPLLIVLVLAAFGMTFDTVVYAGLAVVCPIVAGVTWWIYREMDRRVNAAEKEDARESDR